MIDMKKETGEENRILEFPCRFPIKAMGKSADDFDVLILAIVRKYVSDIHEGALKTRLSRDGNFISVTVTIEAQNQEQLDSIYQELSAHERVIMAL